MIKSIFKYSIMMFSIIFLIMSNSCKKSATSSNGNDTYIPVINIKVGDDNISSGTGSYDFNVFWPNSKIDRFTVYRINFGYLEGKLAVNNVISFYRTFKEI